MVLATMVAWCLLLVLVWFGVVRIVGVAMTVDVVMTVGVAMTVDVVMIVVVEKLTGDVGVMVVFAAGVR